MCDSVDHVIIPGLGRLKRPGFERLAGIYALQQIREGLLGCLKSIPSRPQFVLCDQAAPPDWRSLSSRSVTNLLAKARCFGNLFGEGKGPPQLILGLLASSSHSSL